MEILKNSWQYVVILILIVYGIFVGEINTAKEKELNQTASKLLATDSLLKVKEEKLKHVDFQLDSIHKVNKTLVTSVKGSVNTIENLVKKKKISDKDRKEALKWLEK